MNATQLRIISKYHGAVPSGKRQPTLRELRLARMARRIAQYTGRAAA
jgi:hypothetical protein